MLIICLERKIWNSMNFKLRILQKDVREPHISNGFREAFRVLLRILARLAGRLITQLSHFPTLFGSLFFWYQQPRNAGHFLFDIDNRVEIQKLNQVAAELPTGWVFGVQLCLWQIQALIKIETDINGKTKKNNYLVPKVQLRFYLVSRLKWWKELRFLTSFY